MASKYGRRAETPAHDSEVREPHYPFHSNDSRNDGPHNSRSSGMAKRNTQGRREPSRLSTRHVQDGIRFVRMLFQLFDGLGGRENEQGDLAPLGFAFHVVHHRQGARSSANDQTTTLPGNLLFD